MKKYYLIMISIVLFTLLYASLDKITFSLSSNLENDKMYENIYIHIPVNSLIYKKIGSNLYKSNVAIEISFLDKHENPKFSEYIDTSIIFENYNLTKIDSIIDLIFKLPIEEGSKFINIFIEDRYSDNSIIFKSKLLKSKIIEGESFINNIVPLDSNFHFVCSDSMPFIISYTLVDSADYQFKIRIFDFKKNYYSMKYNCSKSGLDTLNLSFNLDSGKYTMQVELLKNNKSVSIINTEFVIDFTFEHSDKEYNDLVNALAYFGEKSDIEYLRKVKPKERKQAWIDFWKKTKINLSFPDFINRYKYVNQEFSVYNKKGYKTDFGRIFLLFGKPDEIDRHPFDIDSKPYEVWYYYSLGFEFLFVDEHNYGEYILQNSYDEWR